MPTLNEVVSTCILSHLGGRSQRWLGREMGISPGAISKLMNGGTAWTLDHLAAAARVLDVPVHELLGATAHGDDLSDEERLAVLVLRTKGWKGLTAEGLSRLRDP